MAKLNIFITILPTVLPFCVSSIKLTQNNNNSAAFSFVAISPVSQIRCSADTTAAPVLPAQAVPCRDTLMRCLQSRRLLSSKCSRPALSPDAVPELGPLPSSRYGSALALIRSSCVSGCARREKYGPTSGAAPRIGYMSGRLPCRDLAAGAAIVFNLPPVVCCCAASDSIRRGAFAGADSGNIPGAVSGSSDPLNRWSDRSSNGSSSRSSWVGRLRFRLVRKGTADTSFRFLL